MSDTENRLHTFGMIKPDVIGAGKLGKVLAYIESRGFTPIKGELQTLSATRARTFYQEHEGKPFYDGLVQFMTAGPVFPMLLEWNWVAMSKHLAANPDAENTYQGNVIVEFRKLVGQTDPRTARGDTIRGLFGSNISATAIHASDSIVSFLRENDFFFGGKL